MLQRASALSIVALTLAGAALFGHPVLGQRAPEWKVAYTDGQAKRGEAVYAANCQMCHMPNLMGGDIAPPVAGAGSESCPHRMAR
jgi:mono/diheme cytochrome c family protein